MALHGGSYGLSEAEFEELVKIDLDPGRRVLSMFVFPGEQGYGIVMYTARGDKDHEVTCVIYGVGPRSGVGITVGLPILDLSTARLLLDDERQRIIVYDSLTASLKAVNYLGKVTSRFMLPPEITTAEMALDRATGHVTLLSAFDNEGFVTCVVDVSDGTQIALHRVENLYSVSDKHRYHVYGVFANTITRSSEFLLTYHAKEELPPMRLVEFYPTGELRFNQLLQPWYYREPYETTPVYIREMTQDNTGHLWVYDSSVNVLALIAPDRRTLLRHFNTPHLVRAGRITLSYLPARDALIFVDGVGTFAILGCHRLRGDARPAANPSGVRANVMAEWPSSTSTSSTAEAAVPFFFVEILPKTDKKGAFYMGSLPTHEDQLWNDDKDLEIGALLNVSGITTEFEEDIRWVLSTAPGFRDGEAFDPGFIESALWFIENQRNKGLDVLLHSAKGRSRSVYLAILYLVTREKMSYKSARALVARKQPRLSMDYAYEADLTKRFPSEQTQATLARRDPGKLARQLAAFNPPGVWMPPPMRAPAKTVQPVPSSVARSTRAAQTPPASPIYTPSSPAAPSFQPPQASPVARSARVAHTPPPSPIYIPSSPAAPSYPRPPPSPMAAVVTPTAVTSPILLSLVSSPPTRPPPSTRRGEVMVVDVDLESDEENEVEVLPRVAPVLPGVDEGLPELVKILPSTRTEGALFLGAMPTKPHHVLRLGPEVGAILNLSGNTYSFDLGGNYEVLSISQRFQDGHAFDKVFLDSALDWIHAQRMKGLGVLIHCLQGRSRSVYVTIRYLMDKVDMGDLTVEKRYEQVRALMYEKQPRLSMNMLYETDLLARYRTRRGRKPAQKRR